VPADHYLECPEGPPIEAAVETLPGGGRRLRFDLPGERVFEFLELEDARNQAAYLDGRLAYHARPLTDDELAEANELG
jgi:hypothetical protein